MNAEKIALAVKNYLITLALADKLPSDLNDLELDSLEEVIKDTEEDDAYIEKAGHYLSDGDISTKEMCLRINKHEDQNDYIDNVDGVLVWCKVTNNFTCAEFLDLIGFVE